MWDVTIIAVLGSALGLSGLALAAYAFRKSQQADTSAERSQAHFQAVFQTVVDGVVTINAQGIITEANRAIETIFGYAEEELIGQNVKILMPEPDRHRHDGYISHYKQTGQSGIIGVGRDVVGRHKDGSTFPMSLAIGEYEEEGQRFFTGVIRDITERVQQERDLSNSKRQLQAILDASLECIAALDRHGRIVEFNPAAERVFGYSKDAVHGQPFVDVILQTTEQRLTYSPVFSMMLQRQEVALGQRIEVEASRKGGETFTLELAMDCIGEGEQTFFVVNMRDVTEDSQYRRDLIEAKEQAEDWADAKATILAMMSHEIRTPLNGVLGILDLLKDTQLDREQRDFVGIAQDSGHALMGLISNILDYSKMEANKLALEREPVDLRLILRAVAELIEPKLSSDTVTLDCKVDLDVPDYFLGDTGRIRQVLLNLASNAVKFTEEGSIAIHVAAVPLSGGRHRLLFSVRDTGIGIPAADLERLFQQYATLAPTSSQKFGSTGLGLVISQGLVELMGGKIQVDSQEGQGSTFWFELDVEACDPPYDSVEERDFTAADLSHRGGQGLVLLAEDNPTNLMITRLMLEKAGHHVDTAINGREALEAVAAKTYELVLMDVNMPEMDGIEAIEAIRALTGPRSEVPIVALTALAMKGDKERILKAGADDYLAKPIDKQGLLRCVQYWVASAKGISEGQVPASHQVPAEPIAPKAKRYQHIDAEVVAQLGRDTDPALLPELLSLYGEDTANRLEKIAASVMDQDLTVLEHEVHSLGSSAALHGLLSLSKCCREVEEHCRALRQVEAFREGQRVVDLGHQALDELAHFIPELSVAEGS